MNKDNQRTILAGHYEGSLDFRKGQGKDEITAMEPALRGPGNAAETANNKQYRMIRLIDVSIYEVYFCQQIV